MQLNYGRNDPQSDERLGELILYVANKCADDLSVGATKLNKILWWSDFLAYMEHGEAITWSIYQRLEHGPAPRRLRPVRRHLVACGRAKVQEVELANGLVQHRLVPLDEPDLSQFSDRQVCLIDGVIGALWGDSAADVSELSHGNAWRIAENHESIPYQAAFLSDERVTDHDVARTKELAAKFAWV